MVDRELSSWKEIAGFLGVSVRTAQGWERDRALPIRRLPGPRGRVSVSVAALEDWKHAAPVPAPTPAAVPTTVLASRPWRWRLLALLGAVVVFVAGGAAFRDHALRAIPASFRVEPESFVVLNDRGQELWRKKIPGLDAARYAGLDQPFVWFGDLDGDGTTTVVFLPLLTGDNGRAGPLVCYTASGVERWRYLPSRAVRTRHEEFSPPFFIMSFVVAPLARDGGARVVVTSRHHLYYPFQTALLRPDGRVLREYWHAGYFRTPIVADVDGDGRPEIVLGGISNGSRVATLVVLDPDTFTGASAEENQDYQLLGFSRGVEKARILFPRTCMSTVLAEPFNFVTGLFVEQEGIAVGIAERASTDRPVVYYHLDRQLQLRHVEASTEFEREHAQLHTAGTLDHVYAPGELASLHLRYLVNHLATPPTN